MGLASDEMVMTPEVIIAYALAAAPSNPLPRHPRFKKAYILFYLLATVCLFFPYWVIYYSIRSNRPRKGWTIKRCLRVRWSRVLCSLVATCEVDNLGRDLSVELDPLSLEHSHPVTISPAPSTWLVGHPAEMMDELHESRGEWIPRMVKRLDPFKIGVWGRWNDHLEKEKIYGFEHVKGFWYAGEKATPEEGPLPREPGDPVGLIFHGGGYLCGTAAEYDGTANIPKNLVKHSPIHHILSIDYRLAPTAPWPLPLLDAISAYHHLVKVERVNESDIVLFGDSAGGHLASGLSRWIRDEGWRFGLRGPKGLVVMSPWVDVGFTNAWGEGRYHNADSDTIDDSFGPFASSLLLRAIPNNIAYESEYLSPASLLIQPSVESYKDFPPTFMVHGSAERLSTSIQTFYDRLQSSRNAYPHTSGIQDVSVIGQDCVHDFLIFNWQAEESATVYERLDGWLRELLSSEDIDSPFPTTPQESVIPPSEPTSTIIDEIDSICASPEALKASPDWRDILESQFNIEKERYKLKRKSTKQSLKSQKSPMLGPIRRDTTKEMIDDISHEAVNYIDLSGTSMPSLDLGNSARSFTNRGREWLGVFTSQLEKGEWDWEVRSSEGESDDSEEDHQDSQDVLDDGVKHDEIANLRGMRGAVKPRSVGIMTPSDFGWKESRKDR